MSREILFRGRREDNGEWVYGSLVMVRDAEFDKEYPCIVVSYDNDSFDWYNVDLKTIGQYTGLKDKNGVKILEGDILRHHKQGDRVVYYPFNENSGTYGLKCIELGYKSYLHNSNIYEVIGNIHDK